MHLSSIRLILVSIICGTSLAFGILSQNPINLYWALFGLLGIHLITLLVWLISFFLFANVDGSFCVHYWLWLVKKFSQKKDHATAYSGFY